MVSSEKAFKEKFSVRIYYILLLLMFYGVFVLGDIATTFWLIKVNPAGISGEMNPLAIMVFKSLGFLKMFIFKIVIFILFTAAFMFIHYRYGFISRVNRTREAILFGSIVILLAVVLNNVASTMIVSVFRLKAILN